MAATPTLPQRPESRKLTDITVFERSGVLVLRGYGNPVRVSRGHLYVRGVRRMTKETGLDRKTVRAVVKGMKVKLSTLARVVAGLRM